MISQPAAAPLLSLAQDRMGLEAWVVADVRPLQLGVRARAAGWGRTRLILRDRFRSGPVDLSVPFWPFFLVADLIVQPTMLLGIKRRVEWTRERSGSSSRPEGNATVAPVVDRST